MRRAAIAWGLALVGLWSVGAAASWVPRGWLPDPAFLVALAAGLHLPGATGVVAAAAAGWSADMLSGAPSGVHVVLALAVWAAARAGQRRVELTRPVLLMPFAAALAAAGVAGLWLQLWMLAGLAPPGRSALLAIALPHVAVNALCAPGVRRLLELLLGRIEVEEPVRGSLRLGAGTGAR